jgi:hypothetical protein
MCAKIYRRIAGLVTAGPMVVTGPVGARLLTGRGAITALVGRHGRLSRHELAQMVCELLGRHPPTVSRRCANAARSWSGWRRRGSSCCRPCVPGAPAGPAHRSQPTPPCKPMSCPCRLAHPPTDRAQAREDPRGPGPVARSRRTPSLSRPSGTFRCAYPLSDRGRCGVPKPWAACSLPRPPGA